MVIRAEQSLTKGQWREQRHLTEFEIENDLREGLITEEEAQARRSALEEDSYAGTAIVASVRWPLEVAD